MSESYRCPYCMGIMDEHAADEGPVSILYFAAEGEGHAALLHAVCHTALTRNPSQRKRVIAEVLRRDLTAL